MNTEPRRSRLRWNVRYQLLRPFRPSPRPVPSMSPRWRSSAGFQSWMQGEQLAFDLGRLGNLAALGVADHGELERGGVRRRQGAERDDAALVLARFQLIAIVRVGLQVGQGDGAELDPLRRIVGPQRRVGLGGQALLGDHLPADDRLGRGEPADRRAAQDGERHLVRAGLRIGQRLGPLDRREVVAPGDLRLGGGRLRANEDGRAQRDARQQGVAELHPSSSRCRETVRRRNVGPRDGQRSFVGNAPCHPAFNSRRISARASACAGSRTRFLYSRGSVLWSKS